MRLFKYFIPAMFIIMLSCNKDDGGERLMGSMRFTTETTGTDPGTKYHFTFSGLVGDLEIPNGIMLGPNADTTVSFNRVGEKLSVFVMELPAGCGVVSSSSSTTSQLGFNDNPSEVGAVYESIFLVPLDGSTGELKFEITCN